MLNDQDLAKRFRAYCWRAIDNAANDAYGFLNKGAQYRIPLSMIEDIPAPDYNSLSVSATFCAAGDVFPIFDCDLADALRHLSPLQREIILRSFFLQQTDAEIAKDLKHSRRTICNYKLKALRQMKKKMEDN